MGLSQELEAAMTADTATIFADGTSEMEIDGEVIECSYLPPSRSAELLGEGVTGTWRGVVEVLLSAIGAVPRAGKLVKIDGQQYRISTTNTDGPLVTMWLERS